MAAVNLCVEGSSINANTHNDVSGGVGKAVWTRFVDEYAGRTMTQSQFQTGGAQITTFEDRAEKLVRTGYVNGAINLLVIDLYVNAGIGVDDAAAVDAGITTRNKALLRYYRDNGFYVMVQTVLPRGYVGWSTAGRGRDLANSYIRSWVGDCIDAVIDINPTILAACDASVINGDRVAFDYYMNADGVHQLETLDHVICETAKPIIDNIYLRRVIAEGAGFSVNPVLTDAQAFSITSGTNSIGTYAFGTADAQRVMVACLFGYDGIPSAVSIGGVSATRIADASAAAGNSEGISMWYASVPTGTTGSVTATFGASGNAGRCELFRIVTSTPAPIAAQRFTATSATQIDTGTVTSSGLNVPSGGCAISMYASSLASTDNGVTWTTGGAEVSETIRQNTYHTISCAVRTKPGRAKTIVGVPGGNSNNNYLAQAVWKP